MKHAVQLTTKGEKNKNSGLQSDLVGRDVKVWAHFFFIKQYTKRK